MLTMTMDLPMVKSTLDLAWVAIWPDSILTVWSPKGKDIDKLGSNDMIVSL
jgi:hypothetical protein